MKSWKNSKIMKREIRMNFNDVEEKEKNLKEIFK